MTPRLIGIKRKPCEVSQIPKGTSLNSYIMPNLKITLHDWSNIPSEVKRWQ
jgi:hypothetical protein